MKTFFRKSVVAGAVEVKDDMTEGEKKCVTHGLGAAGGVLAGNAITSAVGWTTGMLLSTKVIATAGVAVAGVGIGKAFVRGFVEEWHVQKVRIAMDMTKEERWMEEGKLTK